MDDTLAQPNAEPKKPLGDNVDENEEESSGDEEEGGLDWTKLLPQSARPVIPKRGEKEFEPSGEGGSNLQQFILNRARNAMFEALRTTRTISPKSLSYGIYHPELARVSVPIARGQIISALGHSAPRPTILPDGTTKIQKRLELLPEEAIYLIERGSLFCWRESQVPFAAVYDGPPSENPFELIAGAPMTVQQAYSELLGKEDLTLEKYQVYAYLKRLGYAVTRTVPPNEHYPAAAPFPSMKLPTPPAPGRTIMQRIRDTFSFIPNFINHLLGQRSFSWWAPVRLGRWIFGKITYGDIFRRLRFIPAGHSIPLYTPPEKTHILPDSPYKFFFNFYKPPTPFKKSTPGPPDYQVAVVNARTTPMPSLHELTALYDISPELPIPPPKYRKPLPPGAPPRGPNPFSALRAGKKTVVVAVVDAGNVGFFRFAQGEWGEWPMVGMDYTFSVPDAHMHNPERFLGNERLDVVPVRSLSGGANPRSYGNPHLPSISLRYSGSQNRALHLNPSAGFQDGGLQLSIAPPPPPIANLLASDFITSNTSLASTATMPTPRISTPVDTRASTLCDDPARFDAWVACFDAVKIEYAPPTREYDHFDTILAILPSLKPAPFENTTFYRHLSPEVTFDNTGVNIESYGLTWGVIAQEWEDFRVMPESEAELQGNCRSAFMKVFRLRDYSVKAEATIAMPPRTTDNVAAAPYPLCCKVDVLVTRAVKRKDYPIYHRLTPLAKQLCEIFNIMPLSGECKLNPTDRCVYRQATMDLAIACLRARAIGLRNISLFAMTIVPHKATLYQGYISEDGEISIESDHRSFRFALDMPWGFLNWMVVLCRIRQYIEEVVFPAYESLKPEDILLSLEKYIPRTLPSPHTSPRNPTRSQSGTRTSGTSTASHRYGNNVAIDEHHIHSPTPKHLIDVAELELHQSLTLS
ncbi:tRNA-splicing endonuclease subunit sen54 [Paramarasmius palmivorus]|uniref:tRNA-splicing endonuclease subunit sen54 n=1 Tax=Paramarasmius palmivorus TaxID=297713 RepID=A0AAW0BWD7_9AGAR